MPLDKLPNLLVPEISHLWSRPTNGSYLMVLWGLVEIDLPASYSTLKGEKILFSKSANLSLQNFPLFESHSFLSQDMNLASNTAVQEVGVYRKWEGDRQGTAKRHFYLPLRRLVENFSKYFTEWEEESNVWNLGKNSTNGEIWHKY